LKLDNSRSSQIGHEDGDGSDDFEPRSESESENRNANKTAEVTVPVVTQDENINHNLNKEAEEDHNGSDDEDDDEGTQTYWRVKAKEGHKVIVCSFAFMFVLLRFCIAPEEKKSRHSRHSPFFHEGCSHCNSQRQE
jgi:hypothetical protein